MEVTDNVMIRTNSEAINANEANGYVISDIGGRSENQDSYGWTICTKGLVCAVCDGMGGGPAGKTASSIAVSEILNYISNYDGSDSMAEIVQEAVEHANIAVYNKACANPEMQGMGTTCTVLALADGNAVIAHVGDSRVYLLRGHRKKFRTFDHSMVFELVKQKVITEEQARQSAQSNVITKALGLSGTVEVEIDTVTYRGGDRFMLSTDGIHGAMPETELLEDVTDSNKEIQEIVSTLSEKVNTIGKEKGGGHDNNTIMLLQVTRSDSDNFLKRLWRQWFACVLLFACTQILSAQSIVWQVTPKYDSLEPCGNNIWKGKTAGKQVLFDAETEIKYTETYDSITPFSDNYALGLKNENSRWRIESIINKQTGQETKVTDSYYATDKSYYSEKLIPVADPSGLQGYIDVNGQPVIKCKYKEVAPFHKGIAHVKAKNGKTENINAKGKSIKFNGDEWMFVKEELATNTVLLPFKQNNVYGYKHSDSIVVLPQFHSASLFYGDYARVAKNDKVGLVRLNDNPLTTIRKKTKKTERLLVESPQPVNPDNLVVALQKGNDSPAILQVVENDDDGVWYDLKGIKQQNDTLKIQVYYNELLQHEQLVIPNIVKPKIEPKNTATATLYVGAVSKRNSKADKNDYEYIVVPITNTSNVKFTGSATIYVDGVPYTTKLNLAPKRSQTIGASVKVTRERFATVYVQLSNGYKSAAKKLNLKPFY